MTIGPDKKPRIREFGNVRASKFGIGSFNKPEVSSEMEPLTDVIITDKEVKVIFRNFRNP
jgi:HSP20 family protein